MKGLSNSEILKLTETEIEYWPNGWKVYRFGIVVAYNFPNKKISIEWIRKTYGYLKV